MAELLVAQGWAEPDSLAPFLADALPEGYYVLANPTIHRRALDVVVVGPQGLFVLCPRNWEGEIRPARFGPWMGQLPSGREVRYPNPAEEAHHAARALRAFLRDEFPSLRPMIWHFLVLMHPDAELASSEAAEARPMTAEAVVGEITSEEVAPRRTALGEGVREQLALAFRDRRLTATQRASKPFTFRTGGLLGSGKKTWTLRAAVRHMNRHPEDGVHHLRNGTLVQWLSEEGAEHLAQLAQDVLRHGDSDSRVALETFLVGTGLTHRPPLSIRPRVINLGFILSGEGAAKRLRVGTRWGRGYLFGALQASESWLGVEPGALTGGSIESIVSVSARTDALLISPTPYEAEIAIHSNASEEPVAVPVRFRVMGMPSRFNRRVLRPLAGFLSAGLLGAAVGWLLSLSGAPDLAPIPRLASRAITPPAAWAVLVGLAWGLLGAFRGLRQQLAWPTSFALRRWLLRTLAWCLALFVVARAGLWCFELLYPSDFPGSSVRIILLTALACGILPAVLDELRTVRAAEHILVETTQALLVRPLAASAIGIVLAVLVAVGVPAAGLARDQYDLDNRAASAQEWAGDRSEQLETGLNGFIDRLYLRYYDRRAPEQPTPTETVPTASPTPAQSAS